MTQNTEYWPKISVITPSFNQGGFIEKTITSVLSQSYPNLEFIIVDGGSSDNTVEVIKKYENSLHYWVSEPDRGQSHAINKGMAIATGEILTWLNSDDIYLPGALHRFASAFQENPDIGIVVGEGRIVDLQGKEIYYARPNAEINLTSLYGWLNDGDFLQPSSAFSRTAWYQSGPIDESVHIALDVDLWLRMAKNGVIFKSVNELLSEALSHPNAKTTAFEKLMFLDCSMVIIQHGGRKYVEKQLIDLVNKYSWYDKNYQIIVNNPIIKILRPIIKRIARNEDQYWSEFIPPWLKK
ncbi:glycosyltransferase family 2 protein [Methylomonas fluvii]|uniref:Glycosyltransferase n=1 Tax=Methylomonas fluvii TaxID=1854564 RepID=A0ABR9DDA0_9GAMM|nr:glycosyltransferase family 2 protein [Methylomonas fluvii]MBD9361077.1 glycosyltransferase [Methylomonas fluvii]